MDAAFFRDWLTRAAGHVEAAREHLTDLDAAIGDGDHGVNLSRGFAAVAGAIAADDPRGAAAGTPGAVLTLAGNTLISKVGGASGPLYGTALRSAGRSLGDAPRADLPALAAALQAADLAVRRLGGAHDGDKTLIDALGPAAAALARAAEDSADPVDALTRAADAARAGATATIPMRAAKGRASYLGERSVGHEDPGAASTALLLAALRETAREYRDRAR